MNNTDLYVSPFTLELRLRLDDGTLSAWTHLGNAGNKLMLGLTLHLPFKFVPAYWGLTLGGRTVLSARTHSPSREFYDLAASAMFLGLGISINFGKTKQPTKENICT